MHKAIRKAGLLTEELLYPHAVNCLCCTEERRVSVYDSLCDPCREKLKALRIPPEACDRCLMPVERGKPCAFCAAFAMRDILRVFAPFRYTDEARAIIHAFKFDFYNDALPVLTDSLSNALTVREFDCIVPVPMHRLRLMDRGSNHTEILAKALSEKIDIPVYLPLERIAFHRPQSRTQHKNRMKNVENAFRCRADVNGLKILLLDDVRTTGSTSAECARMLKKTGARSVSLCVCAVVYRNILHEKKGKKRTLLARMKSIFAMKKAG